MRKTYEEMITHVMNPAFLVDTGTRAILAKNHYAKAMFEMKGAEAALHAFLAQTDLADDADEPVKINVSGMIYNVYCMDAGQDCALLLFDSMPYLRTKKFLLYEYYLESVLEAIGDGIFITDREGTTLGVNATYERVYDIKREELEGRNTQDLIREGYFSDTVILPAMAAKQNVTKILQTRNKKTILVTGSPIYNPDGEVIMGVSIARDLSELNATQNQLQYQKALNEVYAKNDYHAIELIAKSKTMLDIIHRAKQIAPFPTTIYIAGETGTGKEVITNYIHKNSKREEKPFLKINCSALPEQLLESELFGYKGGAFTGAKKEGKPGLLELADGGTLLLDEIGDMPMALQVKLLRFLEEGEFMPIGDTKARKVDVRIISASNVDIRKLIREGKFRSDLFYRINVVEIKLPPLRERKEDIESLAEHFLRKFCEKYGLVKTFSPEVIQYFNAYNWPGNIRQLRNIIENLIVSTPGNIITASYLPQDFLLNASVSQQAAAQHKNLLKMSTDNLERGLIQKALAETGGLRRAARALGVNHATLYRKMEKLGIQANYASELAADGSVQDENNSVK